MSTFKIQGIQEIFSRRNRLQKNSTLTQEYLNKLFLYDPETGILYNKVYRSARAKIGQEAGTLNENGYIKVRIRGIGYQAHRLIWIIVYGYNPENAIDHINKDKKDNRLSNLREVTLSCNSRNSSLAMDNKSGVKGICYSRGRKTWVVYIFYDNKLRALGYFKDFTEAVCHRYAAEQCLSWNDCDSNSPAYQYLNEQGILK